MSAQQPPPRQLESQINVGNNGEPVTALNILSNTCVNCHQPCTSNFVALGYPYHCLIHQACSPYYDYRGYPYDQPVSVLKK